MTVPKNVSAISLLTVNAVIGLTGQATGQSYTQLPTCATMVDNLVNQKVGSSQPGVAVLVIADGKVLRSKGYGLADVEKKRRITRQTMFELASVSKQFTAMAVMILAERGKLSFEDDLRKLVPEIPLYNKKRPIRLTDCLWHTSGLPDYLEEFRNPIPGNLLPTVTNEGIAKRLRAEKLRFATGSRDEYSNTNYVLLALVVERASGQPFAEFMRDEVFRPAGMKSTCVFQDLHMNLPRRARGYEVKDGEFKLAERPNVVSGDGNVWSNLDDLEAWDSALRNGKLVGARTMSRAWAPGQLDDGRKISYGFGWAVQSFRGDALYDHDGEWGGFRNYIGRYLNGRLTVAVLGNNGSFDADELADQIAGSYIGIPEAITTLQKLTRKGRPAKCMAFTPEGGWAMLTDDKGYEDHGIPLAAARKLRDEHGELQCIAFTPKGSWIILSNKNEYAFGTRDPEEDEKDPVLDAAVAKLTQLRGRGKKIKWIAFAPGGGWAILTDDNGYAYNDPIPRGAAKQLQNEEGEMKSITFTPDGGWVMLVGHNGYRYGDPVPDAAVKKLEEERGELQNIAFAPGGGWVILYRPR